jgi:hypothetical protein
MQNIRCVGTLKCFLRVLVMFVLLIELLLLLEDVGIVDCWF